MKVRNTFIIFIVSGFWHGANWTFIVWGALNAIYFLPLLLAKRNRQNMEVVAANSYLPRLKEFFQIGLTFTLTLVAWVFFRAENINHALNYLERMFSLSLFTPPNYEGVGFLKLFAPLLMFFMIIEWFGRTNKYAIETLSIFRMKGVKYGFYYSLMVFIYWFASESADQTFIYFQF